MRRFLLAGVLGLGICAVAGSAAGQEVPAGPVEIEAAIQSHALVNGMTLREANRAMVVRPRFTRRGGVKVATWTKFAGGEVQWIAEVEESSATIWNPVRSLRWEWWQ